jgi:taurine dioxygenase
MPVQSQKQHRWPFDVRPLTPTIGAELIGVDLVRGVDAALFRSIHEAFLQYQVLLFGTQDLPPGRQVEFARHFGEVQIHVMNQYHADGYPELYRLSNLDEHGNPNGKHPDKGTLAWHTDGSWRRVTGHATIIYGEVVAGEGGETHFCDMYGAYERLSPEWKARMANLRAVQNSISRARRPARPDDEAPPRSPAGGPPSCTHPDTGGKCLVLGTTPNPRRHGYEEGRALIEERTRSPVRPHLTPWTPGELIVWDNRA